jgi:hypothetical protein
LAAAYGMPWWAGPADAVGLWLNIPRVRRQAAAVVMDGVAAAGSEEQLPLDWFEAQAMIPEEAAELARQANSDRWQAKTMAKWGMRRG